MTPKKMQVVLYAQHTSRRGEVCYDEEMIERGSDDIFVVEGTAAELARLARTWEITKYPAGEDIFRLRCARSIREAAKGE